MQMLPDSMQSFTPLVQGVAQSNALITVSQNGDAFTKDFRVILLLQNLYFCGAA
ncbi:fimbria/pilus outer membrane usher protein [Escherichia coli]